MLKFDSAGTAYAMLGSQNIWDLARRCHDVLDAASVPHALVGGVAAMLHGYRRNAVGVDVLIRSQDTAAIRESLEQVHFTWDSQQREFRGPEGIPIQFLLSDVPAGDDSSYGIRFPDPADTDVVTMIDGLPAVTLPRLIELKLACGLGNLRRTHRDFADVVELIIVNDLHGEFARNLHKSVRPAFRKLVRNARGEV
jgi:hypothetical protein